MNNLDEKLKDNFYWNGCFWITANSFKDILLGNFELLVDKYLVDENGNEIDKRKRRDKTHKNIWYSKYKDIYLQEYTYYPRGRVQVYDKTVFININPKINIPKVIDEIYKQFDLLQVDRTNIEFVEENGSHYQFELK